MSGIEDRVLALGGMLQALAQVRRIADTGQSETTPVRVALDSVFRIDASDTEAVYGDVASLRGGLRLLRDYLANSNRDEVLPRARQSPSSASMRRTPRRCMAIRLHCAPACACCATTWPTPIRTRR